MRVFIDVYELSNGMVGSAKELGKKLDMHQNSITKAYRKNETVKGNTIKKIGYYYTPYLVFQDDNLVFTGTLKEIADKYYLEVSSLYAAMAQDQKKILKKYTLKRAQTELKYY